MKYLKILKNVCDKTATTYLFKTLVLPGLTYASVISTPLTQDKFSRLNSIVTRFLRYASLKNGTPMSFDNHSYSDISHICNVNDLESVHHYLDVSLVLANIKGGIICPTLESRFQLRDLTYNLRNHRPYLEQLHSRNYILHCI